jgi:hypothetical protein
MKVDVNLYMGVGEIKERYVVRRWGCRGGLCGSIFVIYIDMADWG